MFIWQAKPVLQAYQGYGDISETRIYDRLPSSLKQAVEDFERSTEGHVAMISVGPECSQIIIRS